jgi:MFS superfamily sulfate permease-like transporter
VTKAEAAPAQQVPGLLIVRWSAPLFFANANQFRERIRQLVKESAPPPRWVLVAAEPITDIDTTAGRMLADLDEELNAQGVHLAFAELQSGVRDTIVKYGLLETIDQGHFYRSVTEGVEAFRQWTPRHTVSGGAPVASATMPDRHA